MSAQAGGPGERNAGLSVLLPAGWRRPSGYSNGIVAEGRQVFVAGMIGWDETGRFPGDGMSEQFRQVMRNTLAVLREARAKPQHVVRMTWFITDRDEYLTSLAQIGEIYRELMGKHYPVMAVVQVVALIEAQAKIEIETTAVIPYG